MFRLGGIGLFGFVAMLLWIYCIFDVIASEESLIRNLPKTMWLLIVIFIPTIGSIAWLGLGRPMFAGWRPGDTTTRAQPSVWAPDDGPGWGIDEEDDRERRLRAREAELERRERELRRQETGEDTTDPDDRAP